MSSEQIYRDAAEAFLYTAAKKEREAFALDEKARRCRAVAEEQRKLAQEMILKAQGEEDKAEGGE